MKRKESQRVLTVGVCQNTVSVKISNNGEKFFLGTYDTQKEALMIRNKFVLDNNLVERVGILEYEGE